MTHDQFQSVAVQCMTAIQERLLILDLYAEPTEAETQEFIDAVRRNVSAYRAARSEASEDTHEI